MTTNAQRVRQAKKILAKDSDFKYDPKASLIDLLANLMHYCREENIDFDDATRVASDHFNHESHSYLQALLESDLDRLRKLGWVDANEIEDGAIKFIDHSCMAVATIDGDRIAVGYYSVQPHAYLGFVSTADRSMQQVHDAVISRHYTPETGK